MKTEYSHANDVYSCISYPTSGAWLDTSPARLDTSPISSATFNNLDQLHNESGGTQVTQLSYIWHLRSVTSDWDATSVIATHSYKRLFMHQLSYKQPECTKYLHSLVTRYTTPEIQDNIRECIGDRFSWHSFAGRACGRSLHWEQVPSSTVPNAFSCCLIHFLHGFCCLSNGRTYKSPWTHTIPVPMEGQY